MPLLSALNLGSLLSALGLVTSLIKPVPIVGDLVPSLLGTLGPLINQTISNLPPILAAVDENGDAASSYALCPPIAGYAKSVIPLQTFAPFDLAVSDVYRYRQQQTVNLGSWFVQEAWMEPTFFKCASGNKSSELDIASGFNGDAESARFALERHWDEWITEADFSYLQKIGVNTIRLPIGYWSLGPVYTQGTPFEMYGSVYANSWPRVVRAINWAAKYGLGVLVDLHGAPGAQNDQAHSGTSAGVQGLFDSEADMKATINVLTFLAQQLVPVTNVVGIEILNEPSNVAGLPDFYTRALKTLRQVSPAAAKFPFYIHDGFDLPRFADYVAARSDFVVLDHHQYFVFAPTDPNESSSSLSSDITSSVSKVLLAATNRARGNLVIDEWSCALSNASLANESDPVAARKTFCQGQMETYANATAGWGFWNYRTEDCSNDKDWCFASAVGHSLPASFFSYPSNYPAQPPPSIIASANVTLPTLSPILIPGILSPLSPISQALKAIQVPSTASVLAYANPPSAGDVLAAVEANLISPDADLDEAQSPQVFPASVAAPSSDDTSATSVPADDDATAASTSDDDVSSSSTESTPMLSAGSISIPSKRSFESTLAAIAAASVPGKFAARQLRARDLTAEDSTTDATVSSDDVSAVTASAPKLNPTEAATAKGYSDGFLTAKQFALTSGSRLGFTVQYIADSLAVLSTTIPLSQQATYTNWFMKGLADGETQVAAVLRQGNAAGMSLVAVHSE